MEKESYCLEQMYYISLLRAESIEMLLSTKYDQSANMHFSKNYFSACATLFFNTLRLPKLLP